MKNSTKNEHNLRNLDKKLLRKAATINGRYKHLLASFNSWTMEVWKDCFSINEFARRANISITQAEFLDRHYCKIFGEQPKKIEKPPKEPRKSSVERWLDELS